LNNNKDNNHSNAEAEKHRKGKINQHRLPGARNKNELEILIKSQRRSAEQLALN
jgi:hypothetical protein